VLPGIPYSSLIVGAPRETYPNERRVSLTPQNVALLKKKGFGSVLVERDAGAAAQFLDNDYVKAGATLVSKEELYSRTDIMLKVRPPSQDEEVKNLKEGSTVISFLYPTQNKSLVEKLASRKVNAFAMDMIPRISRAQTFDALR
jgi:NAD(P) transhydrogenase